MVKAAIGVFGAKQKMLLVKNLLVSACVCHLTVKKSYIAKEVPPLNVFFPTAEEIGGVYAQIHASCEVEDNREHLRKEQLHRKEIC